MRNRTYYLRRAAAAVILLGVEVHHILDNLNTPHLKPASEVAG